MKNMQYRSDARYFLHLPLVLAFCAGCLIAPPHDDRLDVPRGGEFPIDLTADATTAWLFTYENVIRDHDQSPFIALYQINLEENTTRREYRTRGLETSGILPPSIVGMLSVGSPVPSFSGMELGFQSTSLDVLPTGELQEAPIQGDLGIFGPLPMNLTAQITKTPFQETWYWFRTVGNNAEFPEQGWPPVKDSGPLLVRETGAIQSTALVYAGCIDDLCRTVVREGGMLFVYGAEKGAPFANAITAFVERPVDESVGFYAACGTSKGHVLLTSQAAYSFEGSAVTEQVLPPAVKSLFSQSGSLQCGFPTGTDEFIWFHPDGRFAIIGWPEGKVVEGDLKLRKVPQYGKRYDHTRFRALRLADGWLVSAGVLVESKEGNGCNNYEYCRAAFNLFDTKVYFLEEDGTQRWVKGTE